MFAIDLYYVEKNISRNGPLNRRSLGFARDDKGDGGVSIESGHWDGGTAGPSTALRSGRDDTSFLYGLAAALIGSAAVPFVIPSEAEGSAVSPSPIAHINGSATLNFVIPTGAYPDFLPRSTRQSRVCALP
jgi:hypothetical protein